MKMLYFLHLIAIVAIVPIIVASVLVKTNAPYIFSLTLIVISTLGMAAWAAYECKETLKLK